MLIFWSLAIVVVFNDPAAAAAGIVADQIMVPAGVDPATFAAKIVEAEALKSFDPMHPTFADKRPDGISYWASYAGDGREVVVYYDGRAGMADKTKVCRIRQTGGGVNSIEYRARRWCFAGFGIALPADRAPPIVTNPAPPRPH